MRLICPSCEAQYEIDEALIPARGREVECSECGHGWHQPAPAAERMVLENPTMPPASPATGEWAMGDPGTDDPDMATPDMGWAGADGLQPMPATSPAALAILQEEAARELSARNAAQSRRRKEAGAGSDPSASESFPADAAGMDGWDPAATAPPPIEEDGPRRLPDPEPLAASLRPQQPPAGAAGDSPGEARGAQPDTALPPARDRSGYTAGFGLALLVAALIITGYVAAPRLADQPVIGPALATFRDGIDQGRDRLHDLAAPATDHLITTLRGLMVGR